MNKKVMAKTLLTALSNYEQFLAAVDKSILDFAQYSYNNYASTIQSYEKITDAIQEKTMLHNMRIRTQKLLERAPQKFRRVLILTYIHQLTVKQIAEITKKTERSVFRNLRNGLEWFTEHINSVADNYDFIQLIDSERWVRNIYNRLQSETTA